MRELSTHIQGLESYDPRYIESKILLSANENPENYPQDLICKFKSSLENFNFNRYPDPLASDLRTTASNAYKNYADNAKVPWITPAKIAPENFLFGNGGDELLLNIVLAWGGIGRKLLTTPPAFSVYAIDAQLTNTELVEIPRKADFSIDEQAVLSRVKKGDIDVVMITSPNNPTGDVIDPIFCHKLLSATDAIVVLDEAYIEFSEQTFLSMLDEFDNLVILHTLSKAFSMAGARLGYVIASTEIIEGLKKVRQPYSVNGMSQLLAKITFENLDIFLPKIEEIKKNRQKLTDLLKVCDGVEIFESHANFVLLRLSNAHEVYERLHQDSKILVRDFSTSPFLENCLRVSIGNEFENKKFIEALKPLLS